MSCKHSNVWVGMPGVNKCWKCGLTYSQQQRDIKEKRKMDTQEMLLAIIRVAEAHGKYDGYDDYELEYQELCKKAKAFNKKIKDIYDEFKEKELL